MNDNYTIGIDNLWNLQSWATKKTNFAKIEIHKCKYSRLFKGAAE